MVARIGIGSVGIIVAERRVSVTPDGPRFAETAQNRLMSRIHPLMGVVAEDDCRWRLKEDLLRPGIYTTSNVPGPFCSPSAVSDTTYIDSKIPNPANPANDYPVGR